MKQPRAQCTHGDLQTTALDRVLKYHAKYCTYWIFSGDRHCSCGRDTAMVELEVLRALAASGADKKA